jgi:hypothetical protein
MLHVQKRNPKDSEMTRNVLSRNRKRANTKNAENAVFHGRKRQENEQVTLRDAEQLGKR